MDQQVLLILENSTSILESKSEGNGDVVLEGIFAQFGVVNNNDRIYEENEYLPHLDYLNDKIKSKRLMGELDHPDKFDVSLQKVSHIIENLEYDKSSRCLKGKVRLLNTDAGITARRLVEAGVPLSISSRAAGVVGPDKKVKLKKIFTYDLVADPGFENAQLSLVNESLGFSPKSNFHIYDVSEMYDPSSLFQDIENRTEQKNNMNMGSHPKDETVKVSELNEYSKLVKKEIELLERKLSGLIKKVNTLSSNDDTIAKVIEYTNYVAEKLNGTINYCNYLSENVDTNITAVNKLKGKVSDTIDYSNYIAERLNLSDSYQNYLAENLDKNISFSNYISEKLNENINYSNYLAENINRAIEFGDYLAENLNDSIGYSEYLGENLDLSIKHNDYLAEAVNKSIGYTEYIAEQTDKAIQYSDYVVESINEKEKVMNKKRKEKKAAMVAGENLSEKVNHLISEAKKEKVQVLNESAKFPFLRHLSPEKRKQFINLPVTQKEIVNEAMSKSIFFTEKDVVNIWESALAADKERKNLPKWITGMPTEYAPIWESLSQESRQRIASQAQYIKLETPYQIRNFWATRPDVINFNGNVTESLNESVNPYTTIETVNNSNSAYIENVRKSLIGKL
jgi:ABC-type transporter Mla subunit MlaD